MAIPETYIKLSRKIIEWGWFKNPETLSVWIFLLISANISDREFEGMAVRRGELITSCQTVARTCGLTESKVRTAFRHLIKTGEIVYTPTRKFVHIRIVNYNKFQNIQRTEDINKTSQYSHSESYYDNNMTNKSRTDNEQMTNNSRTNDNTIRNKEINKERSVCEKHAHGIFNNIFLTDEEYKEYRLRVRDIDTVIDELSEAVAAEPGKYSKGDIKAWLNKFIRTKYGKMPERRKML